MSLALSRNQLERQAWLHYYNRTLCEQGVISEENYRRMKVKIIEAPLTTRSTEGRERKTAGKRRTER